MIFQEQLCKFISKTMNQGHKVILGMDANDDIRSSNISKMLEEIGMKEAILNFHKEKSPPATHNRNRSRKSIDSIWTLPGIEAISCEFFPFHNNKGFYSDHRLVWVDLCNESLFSH